MATNPPTAARKEDAAAPAARPTLTPVLNNMAGPVGIHVPAPKADEKRGNDDDPIPSMINLPPGISFVSTPVWDMVRGQANVQRLLKQRIAGSKAEEWRAEGVNVGKVMLKVLPTVDAASPLGKLSEADAIEFLGDVRDLRVLVELLEVETRPTVRKAITAQKEAIEKTGSPQEEDAPDRVTLDTEA